MGGGDLYIGFREADGSWSEAANLGPAVNSTAIDYCPNLTPDGRYLFFTSRRSVIAASPENPLTYDALVRQLSAPGNGNDDLYWISAEVIERLRPKP